ncbi:Modulator of FtsH protease HflK [Limihaloglobus sulfuriphilus]|uniref:Modulator of FtsH protease HflK n=1 Tax=Limihaloglobus sulfuriphilus TaxID=1851148 RepID=A0A1Q2MGW8_9BACT|nr:SPFH domain-containing protein [Limihaloglobus sulfuriphilus]AQQ71930.1 Modulator of FtsH protease HflK [Limihaloglobus sulfuriphilus]
MKETYKRAAYLSSAAFILSLVFFVTLFIGSGISNYPVIRYLGWYGLSGSLIWLYLVILYYLKYLAEIEKLDYSMMAAESSSTIFQGSSERKAMFMVARNRLTVYEKWFTPGFSLLTAAMYIGFGLSTLKSSAGVLDEVQGKPLGPALLMVAVAFISFAFSRYATGTSATSASKALRGGGSNMLSFSLIAIVLAVMLALKFFQYDMPIRIGTRVVPYIMLLIGGEIVVSQIFDIYRPRFAGQYHMPAFDSRLLSTINEPGGILHTAAHTIDYQFGFKVSQTWFYKLLEKAILPLVLFMMLAMYLLSCFVVVNPGQQAVIEYFGSFERGKLAEPGLTLKLPWPIEKAYIYNTDRIQQIHVGYQEKDEGQDSNEISRKPLLWGEKHYEYEYRLLVSTDRVEDSDEGVVPVSIVIAAVPIQYRIKDLQAYVYNHNNPVGLLESICYRELVRYGANARVETEAFGDEVKTNSLLGAGRGEAARSLKKSIQKYSDEIGLGVEIVMVGLQGVHPPLEVAKEYEQVIGSIQKRQAIILDALAMENKIMTELGGGINQVNRLYEMAEEYQAKKSTADRQELEKMALELDEAFTSASGEIFKDLSQARSYAYDKSETARAEGERFASQILAFREAPRIYLQQLRLQTLEETLQDIRKYVVVSDDQDSEVMIVDLQESLAPSLYDIEVPE